MAAACASSTTPRLGPTPLRRLSHAEYNNTIAALLGATGTTADLSPDPALHGFDNEAASLFVSPSLAQDYFVSAETLAYRATANLAPLLPCAPGVDEQACVARFVTDFGRRAYRRPLDDAEAAILIDAYRRTRLDGGDLAAGLRTIVGIVLQSPQFLYRIEALDANDLTGQGDGVTPLTDWEIATRLSYLLWASMPDDELFAAAAAGALRAPEQIAAQINRMIGGVSLPAARQGLARFTNQWLPLAGLAASLSKDPKVAPDWSDQTPGKLRAELEAFLDHVAWNDGGRLRTFLTAPYTFMDSALSSYYRLPAGQPARQSAALIKVDQDPARYGGVLTKAGLQALFAHPARSKPVVRGVFVRTALLCLDVPEPPADPQVDEARRLLDAPTDTLTQKQRLDTLIAGPACVGCHALFNPLGLAFENFDAAGRFRVMDAGQAIDPSGEYRAGTDIDGAFANHRELIDRIAVSPTAAACFARQVFRYAAGRRETTADLCTIAALEARGAASEHDVRQLFVGLALTPGFRFHREATP